MPQNLVSSFMSHIYLAPFDHFIINNYTDKGVKYLRYVDDFYLIYSVDKNHDIGKVKQFIYTIENELTEFLNSELLLEINPNKSIRERIDSLDKHRQFIII